VCTLASTTQRTVVPGATLSPIGSKPTRAPSGSLRIRISATSAADARRSAGAASRSPPPASSRRRDGTYFSFAWSSGTCQRTTW
jgi:hypothetical protein